MMMERRLQIMSRMCTNKEKKLCRLVINESFASVGNQHRRVKEFEEGDMILVHLRRERFPKGTYHKLKLK